jgi:hypothetical protein
MSTAKVVTILHPSSAVNNIVNDASGNVAVGNNLTVAGTLTGSTGVMNIGSGQIYKDSSGNVGIGTSSPLSAANYKFLTIQGGSGGAGYSIYNSSGTETARLQTDVSQVILYNWTTTLPTTFYVNGSERMRIDSSGNVGIGTSSPNASAILDAQSTTKGVRFPNMTTTQKNAVSSPAAGLVVFDTTLAKLCVYSGSAWQTITSV